MINPIHILGASIIETVQSITSLLPGILMAVIIVVIGWIFGSMLGKAVSHFLKSVKVDQMLNQIGVSDLSAKAGVNISIANFFGFITRWAIIVSFAMAAAEIVGLSQFSDILKTVLLYIPSVATAAIFLIVSAMVGDAAGKFVEHSLKATNIKAEIVGGFAKWAIVIVAGVLPALSELNIGAGLIEILMIGIVSALSLAFGLAFGLGGKDHASEIIASIRKR